MKHKKLFFIILFLTLFSAVLSITMGTADISFTKALIILKDYITGNSTGDMAEKIVINIRGPRILMAIITGTGLAVGGAVFQGVFKNPMGDPYVLGVSSGAALGAAIGLVFNIQNRSYGIVTLMSFGGAVITILLVYGIARTGSRVSAEILLLAGIAVNFLCNSAISLLMVLNREAMDKIVFWTLGSFNSSSYSQVKMAFPVVLAITLAIYLKHKDLDILSLDEESACSLGVQGERVKKLLVILSSLMVAVLVSFNGIIGFVGLIIPHIARFLAGSSHREVLPFSAVIGAAFLILCDTMARTAIPPAELPVGAVTALMGAPYFIYLLIQKKRG